MNISELADYIQSVLGFGTQLSKTKLNVPFSMQESFGFYDLNVCPPDYPTLELLAVVQLDDEYPGIVALKKRLGVIEKATDKIVVYVTGRMSSFERRSLIDHRVNFIVSARQFFIPELAMDLREVFSVRKQSRDKLTGLSPAAQATLIRLLQEGWDTSPDSRHTARSMFGASQYSRVTLSKVVSEFINAGILQLDSEQAFTTRRYAFKASRADTFKTVLPMLTSPVRKKVSVNNRPAPGNGIFYAGDTALAEYTLLAPGAIPVFAMTQKVYSALLESGETEEVTDIDNTRAVIEIWSYTSPATLPHVVDEISLYLTLKEDPDERVQIALSELKEKHSWMKFVD